MENQAVKSETIIVNGMSNREFLERHAQPGRVGLCGGTTRIARLGGFDLLQKYFLSQVVDLQAGVFQKGAKQAVVKTHPIPKRKNLCIIGCGYVFALHHAEEKRQGTPLL